MATGDEFIKSLPKVELHAHINGSLSNETLDRLSQLKYGSQARCTEHYNSFETFALSEGFKKFKYAHELTDTKAAVTLATNGVIKDFAADNVVYVELRTTPRSTPSMSKDDYLTAVIEAIEQSRTEQPSILVKLLVSVCRHESEASGEQNVALAIKYNRLHPDIVCGVDLSGNPASKNFSDFRAMLAQARNAGLKLALHCGETDNELEISEMLAFGMDRLGHGIFITGENEKRLLRNKSVALECCLTSNLLCGSVPNYDDHHFWRFFQSGHPVVICRHLFYHTQTDDFGVFSTSLTKEMAIAQSTFNLTDAQLIELCNMAAEVSFATSIEKSELKAKIEAFATAHDVQSK